MLSTKKLLYKIVDRLKVRTATVSGTTNGNGALNLSLGVSADKTVLSVILTRGTLTNGMCIPWLYDGTIWYAKIVDWTNMSVYGNKSVTVVVRYLD